MEQTFRYYELNGRLIVEAAAKPLHPGNGATEVSAEALAAEVVPTFCARLMVVDWLYAQPEALALLEPALRRWLARPNVIMHHVGTGLFKPTLEQLGLLK